jgi:hypothetical protein
VTLNPICYFPQISIPRFALLRPAFQPPQTNCLPCKLRPDPASSPLSLAGPALEIPGLLRAGHSPNINKHVPRPPEPTPPSHSPRSVTSPCSPGSLPSLPQGIPSSTSHLWPRLSSQASLPPRPSHLLFSGLRVRAAAGSARGLRAPSSPEPPVVRLSLAGRHAAPRMPRPGRPCARRRGTAEFEGSMSELVGPREVPSLSPPPLALPPHAPHLRASTGSGTSRTAQASERLCSQPGQQLPHQLRAQHLKGRCGAVRRRTAERARGLRDTAHLCVGAQYPVVSTSVAPASSIEQHGIQEGAGRGRSAALQD